MGDQFSENYRIQFVDENGYDEEGADGGGLMKEFIQEIIKTSMKDSYGFFLENSQ